MAGECTVRFTGDMVGVEECCHRDAHTVLYTWLQVHDHFLFTVRQIQSELKHTNQEIRWEKLKANCEE